MFDWREKADLPLQEPAARKAILALAGAVAAAIERLDSSKKPSSDSRRAAAEGLAAEAQVASMHGRTRREALSERVILWVDDNPGNNVWERRALESYGVRFVLSTDTAQAQASLSRGPFSAIISDLSRPGDRRAGYTLLESVRAADNQTPYFIYSSSRAPRHVREASKRGAQGLTNDPDELVAMVVAAIR